MSKPVRLQLSRKKGFRLQALSASTNGLPAVNVARGTVWGNYAALLVAPGGWSAVDAFKHWLNCEAGDAFKARVGIDLRGKNLACWCKSGVPCHADVLLEIANG